MSKIGDVSTSYDYITKGLRQSLDTAQEKLSSVVERAYNTASDLGIKSGVTNQTVANYIEDKILPQYRDKLTGNPLPGQSAVADAIKKMADEYRETNYINGKYGREYQDIGIKDLWKERQRIDTLSKWDKNTDTAITNAYKNLRFYVDDQVVSSMKAVGNGEHAVQYIEAKKNWRLLNSANEIAGSAAKKALEKSDLGKISLRGGLVGNIIGGPIGAVFGAYLGDPLQFFHNNSGNIQSYFARNMSENLGAFEQKATIAVNSFFNKAEMKFAPLIKHDIMSADKVIKRDQERLQQELANRESFSSNFISLNNTMFDLAPKSSGGMLATINKARDFLSSKLPVDPYIDQPYRNNNWKPNPLEISKYLRYREAVEKPGVILEQIKNGYVTPQAIEVLDQVYPATKILLQNKILEKMSTEKNIPQDKRLMLFKVFGIPLDHYSGGPLFLQMQQRSGAGVQQTQQDKNQVVNPSKIGNALDNTTTGTRSQKSET
jgi:uncharacterized membrane protein YeaQ/YmgE (transglycosylase-associated protein family)